MRFKMKGYDFYSAGMIVILIMVIVFLIFSLNSTKEDMKNICIENCLKYNISYLKSEGDSTKGFHCFCTDTDGKPREVPSDRIE